MRRGFKSQSEKIALDARKSCDQTAFDRFNPKKYLESLGFVIWSPDDIPGLSPEHVLQLTVNDPNSWSGVTIREGNAAAIILNPTHPSTRQANTLMHEWAHIELRHKPNRVDRSKGGVLLLSDYPSEFEDEADWLAGAVLLPREGLVRFKAQGMSNLEIAEHYGVSAELTNWRIRMTGVERQLQARRSYY